MEADSPRKIPVRGLNEFSYCPRLYYFMYVENIFVESADTVHGSYQHEAQEKRRLRKKTASAPAGRQRPERHPEPTPEPEYILDVTEMENDADPFESLPRNFKFGEGKSGLVGVLDAIEADGARLSPVESKHSSAPDGSHPFTYKELILPSKVWPNDLAQLAGQIYLLRENGYACESGYIYYRQSRQRIQVFWNENIEKYLFLLIDEIRALSDSRPLPLKNSKKCLDCSLNEICLPDETWVQIDEKAARAAPRTIVAPRYDRSILHITDSRAKVGVSGDNLRVTDGEGTKSEFHLKDVLSVSIYGNAQVTTQALGSCMTADIPVVYFTTGGRLKGIIQAFSGKNLDYRLAQYARFQEGDQVLAARTIAAKISNQRTFLRRNSELSDATFADLKELMEKAEACRANDSLLGFEGSAARLYYENFTGMLQEPLREHFSMNGRNRRPPRDPVNALLSFAYSMLARDAASACIAVGLDPGFGFFHKREKGRPSLALDLMEPYRPIIADSAVVRAINTGMVQEKDFEITPAGTVMKNGAKKGLIRAYEARINSEITHPNFNYPMTYRRILEVEVRLLARFLEGELPDWRPLRVR